MGKELKNFDTQSVLQDEISNTNFIVQKNSGSGGKITVERVRELIGGSGGPGGLSNYKGEYTIDSTYAKGDVVFLNILSGRPGSQSLKEQFFVIRISHTATSTTITSRAAGNSFMGRLNTGRTYARNTLETLTGNDRLDASFIKNLPSGGTGGSSSYKGDWSDSTPYEVGDRVRYTFDADTSDPYSSFFTCTVAHTNNIPVSVADWVVRQDAGFAVNWKEDTSDAIDIAGGLGNLTGDERLSYNALKNVPVDLKNKYRELRGNTGYYVGNTITEPTTKSVYYVKTAFDTLIASGSNTYAILTDITPYLSNLTLLISNGESIAGSGQQGQKGDKGDTGATGDVGPTGAAGDVGPAGEKGDQGDAGPQGPQGIPGSGGGSGSGNLTAEQEAKLQIIADNSEIVQVNIPLDYVISNAQYEDINDGVVNARYGYKAIGVGGDISLSTVATIDNDLFTYNSLVYKILAVRIRVVAEGGHGNYTIVFAYGLVDESILSNANNLPTDFNVIINGYDYGSGFVRGGSGAYRYAFKQVTSTTPIPALELPYLNVSISGTGIGSVSVGGLNILDNVNDKMLQSDVAANLAIASNNALAVSLNASDIVNIKSDITNDEILISNNTAKTREINLVREDRSTNISGDLSAVAVLQGDNPPTTPNSNVSVGQNELYLYVQGSRAEADALIRRYTVYGTTSAGEFFQRYDGSGFHFISTQGIYNLYRLGLSTNSATLINILAPNPLSFSLRRIVLETFWDGKFTQAAIDKIVSQLPDGTGGTASTPDSDVIGLSSSDIEKLSKIVIQPVDLDTQLDFYVYQGDSVDYTALDNSELVSVYQMLSVGSKVFFALRSDITPRIEFSTISGEVIISSVGIDVIASRTINGQSYFIYEVQASAGNKLILFSHALHDELKLVLDTDENRLSILSLQNKYDANHDLFEKLRTYEDILTVTHGDLTNYLPTALAQSFSWTAFPSYRSIVSDDSVDYTGERFLFGGVGSSKNGTLLKIDNLDVLTVEDRQIKVLKHFPATPEQTNTVLRYVRKSARPEGPLPYEIDFSSSNSEVVFLPSDGNVNVSFTIAVIINGRNEGDVTLTIGQSTTFSLNGTPEIRFTATRLTNNDIRVGSENLTNNISVARGHGNVVGTYSQQVTAPALPDRQELVNLGRIPHGTNTFTIMAAVRTTNDGNSVALDLVSNDFYIKSINTGIPKASTHIYEVNLNSGTLGDYSDVDIPVSNLITLLRNTQVFALGLLNVLNRESTTLVVEGRISALDSAGNPFFVNPSDGTSIPTGSSNYKGNFIPGTPYSRGDIVRHSVNTARPGEAEVLKPRFFIVKKDLTASATVIPTVYGNTNFARLSVGRNYPRNTIESLTGDDRLSYNALKDLPVPGTAPLTQKQTIIENNSNIQSEVLSTSTLSFVPNTGGNDGIINGAFGYLDNNWNFSAAQGTISSNTFNVNGTLVTMLLLRHGSGSLAFGFETTATLPTDFTLNINGFDFYIADAQSSGTAFTATKSYIVWPLSAFQPGARESLSGTTEWVIAFSGTGIQNETRDSLVIYGNVTLTSVEEKNDSQDAAIAALQARENYSWIDYVTNRKSEATRNEDITRANSGGQNITVSAKVISLNFKGNVVYRLIYLLDNNKKDEIYSDLGFLNLLAERY